MVSAFAGTLMLLAQVGDSWLGTFALVVIALAAVVAAGSLAYAVFVLYARQLQLLEKDARLRAAKAQREADAPPPVVMAPPPPPPPPPAAPQPPPIVITIPVPMPAPAAAAAPAPAPLAAKNAISATPLPPKLVAVLTAAVAVAVGRPFVIKQIKPLPTQQPLFVSTWKERGRSNIHDSHSLRKRSR